MTFHLLVRSILTLVACSLFSCRAADTITAKAASEKLGEVLGHQVVKVFLRGESKSPDAPSSVLLPQVLFESADGTYWIGSLTALHTYNESKGEWKSLIGSDNAVPLNVETICQSADQKIWLRSVLYNSLRSYDGHSWKAKEQVGPDQSAHLPQVMFQGHDGRIWVILKQALSTYNGTEWSSGFAPSRDAEEVYRSLSDIAPNNTSKLEALKQRVDPRHTGLISDVRAALEANSGIVWLASRCALVAFRPGSDEWKVHALPSQVGRPRKLFEDDNGRLWLADDKGQIIFFDTNRFVSRVFDLQKLLKIDSGKYSSAFLINDICQDRQGRIMVASNHGLISLDQKKQTWELFTRDIVLSNSNILSLMRDKRGRIWIGTTEGILILHE